MGDFKIYRGCWIPGLGQPWAIITLQDDNPKYRSSEHFIVIPGKPLNYEAKWWGYNNIDRDVMSDEPLLESQLEFVKGFLVSYLHENRDKFEDKSLYFHTVSNLDWWELPKATLLHQNLQNAEHGTLLPELERIRNETSSEELRDYLNLVRRICRDGAITYERG